MNHSQVAHVWANQSKPKGKGSNMFFDGPTIYSYGTHFPIAKHVKNAQGEPAVIFTRESYSSSTGAHKNLVRHALDGLGIPVFLGYTESSGSYWRSYDFGTDKPSLRKSVKQYLADAQALAMKAKRARKYGHYHAEQAIELINEADRMNRFFKLGMKISDSILSDQELRAIRDKAEAARKAQAIREAAAREEQRKEDAADFEAWKRGEGYGCPWSYSTDENGSAYLRIKGDEVQTSRGAEVPLEDAKRAFRFVKLCKEQNREFRTNGERVRIGYFDLRSVDSAGNIQIGCHYITWERIEECAKAGGFFNESSSAEALNTNHAPTVAA